MRHTCEMMSSPGGNAKPAVASPRPSASFGLALICAVSLGCGSARADGTFAQFDLGDDTGSAVLSVERDLLTFGATYNAYYGGQSFGVSAMYWLAATSQGAAVNLKLGPSFGVVDEDGEDAETQAGLRMVADRYVPMEFGGLYFQAEVNSIDRAWFLLGQVTLAEPQLVLELSRGGSESYSETTLAVSRRLGDGPVSLRAGYRFEDESVFAGISINTF